jgi:hypothetical protein
MRTCPETQEWVRIVSTLKKGEHLFELDNLTTTDPIEAAAYLIHRNTPENDPIWDMRIHLSEPVTHNALYWLSGGDRLWRKSTFYKKKWCFAIDDIDNHYGPLILDRVVQETTLYHLRTILTDIVRPWDLYSFCIRKNLL